MLNGTDLAKVSDNFGHTLWVGTKTMQPKLKQVEVVGHLVEVVPAILFRAITE